MEIKMLDGSTFYFPNKDWEKAFRIKAGDNINEVIEMFKIEVKNDFEDRKVLTKFGYEEWEREYRDHADLAYDIMYAYIRPCLMSIALKKMSPNKKISVIGISEDGIYKYNGESVKKIELKNLEEDDNSEDQS